MSLPENRLTVEQFTIPWAKTPPSRRVEEIISIHNETHHLSDRFTYYGDENGLFMWAKHDNRPPQKVYLNEIIERASWVGEAEGQVADKLWQWYRQNEAGIALWVSPPYPGKYLDTKIIFHEITHAANGQKIIENSASLFTVPSRTTLEILRQLFPEISEVKELEKLRPLLIAPDESFKPQRLIERIKKVDPNAFLINNKLSGQQLKERAIYISNLIEAGANPRLISYEMEKLGLLGQFSLSCPSRVTFSELIVGGLAAEDQYGSLEFTCPSCKKINTRPFGQLLSSCQHCGTNVRC